MVSGAVVISSQTTSVRAANLLASFIIVPVSQLIIGESMIMFWGRYTVLWFIVAALLLIAVVLMRMGLHLFNREELLGRDLDVLDLHWVWRTLWSAFRDGANSVGEWYAGLLKRSLPALRPAVLVMVLALAAAYVVGLRLAPSYVLPLDPSNLESLSDSIGPQLQEFGMMSAQGWWWILRNNVTALTLAALGGVFTFGVAGVILLMAPIGITGYLAGNLALAGQNAGLYLAGLVVPHATLEVPAAILAGAAILRLGMAAVSLPKGTSLGESWIKAVADWARIGLGLVLPLLVGASLLEVFVTPRIAAWLLGG
jgi:uncharacterized membrane protein SpoIIM required for sporulation